MTSLQLLELLLAAAIFAAGIWLYRRPRDGGADDSYGSQLAVLLFVVAVLVAVHALGVMNRIIGG
jgi:hypothetical protein